MRLPRILSGFLTVCMCVGGLTLAVPSCVVSAADSFVPVSGDMKVTLELDGTRYSDTVVLAINRRPLAAESFWRDVLGISVLRYPDSAILVQGGEKRIVLREGDVQALDGLKQISLDSAPQVIDGELYLPLIWRRFLGIAHSGSEGYRCFSLCRRNLDIYPRKLAEDG